LADVRFTGRHLLPISTAHKELALDFEMHREDPTASWRDDGAGPVPGMVP
jgi:hypothetical protein